MMPNTALDANPNISPEDTKETRGSICQCWWRRLNPSRDSGSARAARAKLRRIRAPMQAGGRMLEIVAAWEVDAFRTLAVRLKDWKPKAVDDERWVTGLVVCAGVLSHVKKDTGGVMAKALAGQADKPTLAEVRFKRLLASGHMDLADLLDPMVQAVHLLGGSAPVADLADSLLDWTPARRRKWAQDYWTSGAFVSSQD